MPEEKKVHAVDESAATVSVAGSQETVMVGAIGSYFDLGSVSEWTLELRGENEGICSVGTASVCEGDVVDIEIDSGAEVSCLPSNIGADTYPLHETRLSKCGGHHVAAGGGKLHELGARILGLETDDVRESAGTISSHGDRQGALVNTRSQPLWMGDGLSSRLRGCTLDQECIEHSHHAREETVCMVLESQAQASP